MNLKELSTILGLSQTTVSRALNGYPEVSEATRRRVQDAARTHNYAPNQKAQSLATGRAMTIGHVIPLSTQHEIVNPVFTDFIAGASEVYSQNNYDMQLSVVPDTGESDAYRRFATRRTVDGVIVHGPKLNDPRIALLRDIGMPFVVHGRVPDDDDYCWVDMNNRRAFERATNFLLDLGHRRIALLNGIESMDFAARRRDGYRKALEKRGLTEDPALMRSDEMTEHYGFNEASALLDMPEPPTAFLASSIIVGLGVRRACETRGLKLGTDISLILHDDELSYLRNGGAEPIYTATRSSVREAGRICAQLLLARIAGDSDAPSHRLLDAELTVGQSTGPAPTT